MGVAYNRAWQTKVAKISGHACRAVCAQVAGLLYDRISQKVAGGTA